MVTTLLIFKFIQIRRKRLARLGQLNTRNNEALNAENSNDASLSPGASSSPTQDGVAVGESCSEPIKVVSSPLISTNNPLRKSTSTEFLSGAITPASGQGGKFPRKGEEKMDQDIVNMSESMEVDEPSSSTTIGGVFNQLLASPGDALPVAVSSTASTASTPGSGLDLPDEKLLKIFGRVVGLKFDSSDTSEDRVLENPPSFKAINELLSVWGAQGVEVDFTNLISVCILEIISAHLDRDLIDLKHKGTIKDKTTLMVMWLLESYERSYDEERNHPKVIL